MSISGWTAFQQQKQQSLQCNVLHTTDSLSHYLQKTNIVLLYAEKIAQQNALSHDEAWKSQACKNDERGMHLAVQFAKCQVISELNTLQTNDLKI